MEKRRFEYMLRLCMVPGHHEEERLRALLDFCRSSGTTDVMFFYNCEELNRGHFTPEEQDLWLDLIARMKPVLAREGITTSINPWTTLLHTDRGRVLREGQDFTRMVDPEGREASAVACPVCERFLRYLGQQYGCCAEKIQPNILWVEDDFRLHNHHPLQWGGCFCEKHMELYSERAGRELSREEFVAGLLSPGEVHPFRRIWLEVALQSMLGVARTIRGAVMVASPATRLGLMTSDPVSHCAEGRDWEAVFTALKTEKEPCIRIHLPSYQEITSQGYAVGFANISRQVRRLVPQRIENYGELENFPFSRFSTSLRFSQMQIETNALLGSGGITMDIYDLMGNGVLTGEGYQGMLAESRPFLDTLVNLGFDERRTQGIRVMIDPRCCAGLHTSEGRSMNELHNRERNLLQMWIPFGFTACYETSHTPTGQTVSVSGQYLRNLTQEEIRALFLRNYVVLDGEAVRTLTDLGLGELAGIAAVQQVEADSGVNAYEQVTDTETYCGIREARLPMQTGTGDFIKITYLPGVALREYTHAFSPFDADNGPVMVSVENRVLILPYEHYGMALLSPFRKAIVADALCRAEKVRRPVYADTPYTTVIHHEQTDRTLFSVVNFSGDEYPRIRLVMPDGIPEYRRAVLYTRGSPNGIPAPLVRGEGVLNIEYELPRIQTMVLSLEK